MRIIKTLCRGLHLIELNAFKDERGWFARTYCEREFAALGIETKFPQVNQSQCTSRGTFRGLHYQLPPKAEGKLVRCVQGAVLDVSVDVRRGSPTFLKWYAVELRADDLQQLYVAPGFAHGYLSLTDGASVLYHSSQEYTPALEQRMRFDEPRVGIEWPFQELILSPKDLSTGHLTDAFDGHDFDAC